MTKIPINATKEEVFENVKILHKEIETIGETPERGSRLLHLIGRVRFLQGEFELSKEAFVNSNVVVANNNLPELHENYYWFARIHEEKGDKENAKLYFNISLEFYNENPLYISKEEIIKKINSYN